jgi:hypothetical protein
MMALASRLAICARVTVNDVYSPFLLETLEIVLEVKEEGMVMLL